MFPEHFVAEQLLTYTRPGDQVFDPFCGRGTTVFESLLNDRPAAGSDVNPVAVCISRAKAAAPTYRDVVGRLASLEEEFRSSVRTAAAPTPFFEACYESSTLSEILFLREALNWQTDHVDGFIAAMMLGCLHGESHRSGLYLSNRMPRTISTKPEYSVKWWNERELRPPRRDTFDVLSRLAAFRYQMSPARRHGKVRMGDARSVATTFPELHGQVQLVVTSPPYLNTTDYAEDQWLRLWFLGGAPVPKQGLHPDDRHRKADAYWDFLAEAWRGLGPLLAPNATMVVRIGGAALTKEDLWDGLHRTLAGGLPGFIVQPIHDGITSSIPAREVSAFRSTPPRSKVEHDFAFRVIGTESRA